MLLLRMPQLARAPAANRSWFGPARKLPLKGLMLLMLPAAAAPRGDRDVASPAIAVVTEKDCCAGWTGDTGVDRMLLVLPPTPKKGLLLLLIMQLVSSGADEGRGSREDSLRLMDTSCAFSHASMLVSCWCVLSTEKGWAEFKGICQHRRTMNSVMLVCLCMTTSKFLSSGSSRTHT